VLFGRSRPEYYFHVPAISGVFLPELAHTSIHFGFYFISDPNKFEDFGQRRNMRWQFFQYLGQQRGRPKKVKLPLCG